MRSQPPEQLNHVYPGTSDSSSIPHETAMTIRVMDALQGFQASMEKSLSSIDGNLESMNGRMNRFEARLMNVEKQGQAVTPNSASSMMGQKRTRLTPTSLQVNNNNACHSLSIS